MADVGLVAALAGGDRTGTWTVHVPGGTCTVTWTDDGHLVLTGPAVLVARVELPAGWTGVAWAPVDGAPVD